MLSIFPELLPFSLIGVTIIRVTLGVVILYLGLMTTGIKNKTYAVEMKSRDIPLAKIIPLIFGLIEIITGSFLIAGFLTQIMAIIAIYIFFNLIFIEKHVGKVFDYPNTFYISLIFIALSLLFLGPGIFAVDLPL